MHIWSSQSLKNRKKWKTSPRVDYMQHVSVSEICQACKSGPILFSFPSRYIYYTIYIRRYSRGAHLVECYSIISPRARLLQHCARVCKCFFCLHISFAPLHPRTLEFFCISQLCLYSADIYRQKKKEILCKHARVNVYYDTCCWLSHTHVFAFKWAERRVEFQHDRVSMNFIYIIFIATSIYMQLEKLQFVIYDDWYLCCCWPPIHCLSLRERNIPRQQRHIVEITFEWLARARLWHIITCTFHCGGDSLCAPSRRDWEFRFDEPSHGVTSSLRASERGRRLLMLCGDARAACARSKITSSETLWSRRGAKGGEGGSEKAKLFLWTRHSTRHFH